MAQQLQQPGILPPAERSAIDEEHARLEQFLRDLRDTCENYNANGDCYRCSRTQVATCQGRLTSFFYDFLDLVSEHFENEEDIMRRNLLLFDEDQYFRMHQQEHARLLREVRELMRESGECSSKGNPSEAIRRLYRKISELFGEHAHRYDSAIMGEEHSHS